MKSTATFASEMMSNSPCEDRREIPFFDCNNKNISSFCSLDNPQRNRTDRYSHSVYSNFYSSNVQPPDEHNYMYSRSKIIVSYDHKPLPKTNLIEPIDHYLVIDLNVIPNNLYLVMKIFVSPINQRLPHIFIPWVVAEEVDGIKRSNLKLSKKFGVEEECIKYISEMIHSNHPRIHRQTLTEFRDLFEPHGNNNKKHIIECCTVLANKFADVKVILLSNDCHAFPKYLIWNFEVHDLKNFMKKYHHNLYRSVTLTDQQAIHSAENVENKEERKIAEEKAKWLPKSFILLDNVLMPFLITGMKRIYGTSWGTQIKLDSMQRRIDAFIAHWNIMFSPYTESTLEKFKFLRKYSRDWRVYNYPREECVLILTTIKDIFEFISIRRPKLEISVPEEIHEEMKSAQFFNSFEPGHNTPKISVSEIELSCVFNIFEHIWTVMNFFCGMIMDYYKVAHDFIYKKPHVMPPESKVESLMFNLFPRIEELKNDMTTLACSLSYHIETLRENFYVKFEKKVRDFISSLPDEVEVIDISYLKCHTLCAFCQAKENREMMHIFYLQMKKFVSKINEAINIKKTLKDRNINKVTDLGRIVTNVLDHNWCVMITLCGMIMDYYSVAHNLHYEKPNFKLPENEMSQFLYTLKDKLVKLKRDFFTVTSLNPKENRKPDEKLQNTLQHFVSSLKVPVKNIDTSRFTYAVFCAYCREPENLETLDKYYRRLEKIISDLLKVINIRYERSEKS